MFKNYTGYFAEKYDRIENEMYDLYIEMENCVDEDELKTLRSEMEWLEEQFYVCENAAYDAWRDDQLYRELYGG